MKLTPVVQNFVLHWGSMGTKWGINRTVAQIHALLFLSPRPLPADEIAETLSVARSNVSTSLRELQSWRLVHTVPQVGDRRDHFASHQDVWEMFRVVMDERKRREFDPTLEVLRKSVAELKDADQDLAHTRGQLEKMLDFFESSSSLYSEIIKIPVGALSRLTKLGRKFRGLLETKEI